MESFPDSALVIRRPEGACEADGGVWQRGDIFVAADGRTVAAIESSGSNDVLSSSTQSVAAGSATSTSRTRAGASMTTVSPSRRPVAHSVRHACTRSTPRVDRSRNPDPRRRWRTWLPPTSTSSRHAKAAFNKEYIAGIPNRDNCSGFVKEVALALGAPLPHTANADGIVDHVSASWTAVSDGAEAARQAGTGKLVIAGLKGPDHSPARTSGHVAVVISSELYRSKYPLVWGGSTPTAPWSRQIVPITCSQIAFAFRLCGGDFSTVSPRFLIE